MKKLDGGCTMKLIKQTNGQDSSGNRLSFYLWEAPQVIDEDPDFCVPMTWTLTARLNGEEASLDRWSDYDSQSYTNKEAALKELSCYQFMFG